MSQTEPNVVVHSIRTPQDERVRFHLSMNCANLAASVAFFTKFFGMPAAKHRQDYAKFEVQEPPLVLSLEPCAPKAGGALNHVGLRVPSSEVLVDYQRRLELAGITTTREAGIECCYARQTKFWLHDPDGNLWEVYTLDEDIEHRGYGTDESLTQATVELAPGEIDKPVPVPQAAQSVWSHRLTQPWPTELYLLPESCDQIRLEGTFNGEHTAEARDVLLAATFRALRPGGELWMHNLTADRAHSTGNPKLPGLASVVQCVPPLKELLDAFFRAGFANLVFEKYNGRPCFVQDGVEFRETMLTVRRPLPSSVSTSKQRVLYKGPSASWSADGKVVLQRGEFMDVDAATVEFIKRHAADQFVIASL